MLIKSNNMDCMKSYVFLDIESSGLPDYDFCKTKITEISMVACSHEHLLNTEENCLPRVLHKLTLCINPKKLIDPGSSQITYLDNYNLEYENKFDKNVGTMIVGFLRHLQQPVCLIAHNGMKFDFPILQKELQSIDISLDESIKCIDSLQAFKHIKQLVAEDEKFTMILQYELNQLNDDILNSIYSEETDTEENIFNECKLDERKDWQKFNEMTPKQTVLEKNTRKKRNSNIEVRDEFKLNRINSESARRQLFSQTVVQNRSRLRLTDIFEDTFARLPDNLHAAEDDALTILKLAVAWKLYFIPYAEENAVPFKSIKPLRKNFIHRLKA